MNRRGIPLAPSEGWLTLGLVMLLCLALAWSIDDVALVLGRGALTDFLPPIAILGVLVGFIGPKVGWGRWLTYLVGAAFAALIVPLVVGAQIKPAGTALDAVYGEPARSMIQAVIDLVVHGMPLTNEYAHYMVFLGLLVWATSMFASYAVFGHRRPLNAIVIVGLLLLVNMSLTLSDQLVYLVLFTIASLLLLVRFHVIDEQTEWVRRRIGDPATISTVYLRGGTLFIGVAIVGSLLLMNVARSAPLEGSWSGFSNTFADLSRYIERIVPTGGNARPFGSDFDPNSTSIRGKWQPNPVDIATIKVPVTDRRAHYWRAVTYDRFVMNGWQVTKSDAGDTQVDGGSPLLAGAAESADLIAKGLVTEKIAVTPAPGSGSFLLSPLIPVSVDAPTSVSLAGEGGYLNIIRRRSGDPYTVTAKVRAEGNDEGELSVAALEGAGTDYPEEIQTLYGADAVPPGAMGPKATALLAEMVAGAGNPDNPYDFADYLQRRFVQAVSEGGYFVYDADVNDLLLDQCKDISIVECFSTYKRGFCQWYASTMAIFLRQQGIPARIVEGYLPAQRSPQGEEVIKGDSQHQWVEVYFPGYGWYGFDPTGGGQSKQERLTPGVAGASRPPLASSAVVLSTRPRESEFDPNNNSSGTVKRGLPVGSFIAIGILLAAIFGGLAFITWQRGPRKGTSADHAYRTVTRLAARFGFGPRPNQTVYEYAGVLGDVLPIARPELEMVAKAKVETVYGQGRLSDDRLRTLRDAERRLRLSLLRLAFRRRGRKGR